MLPVLDEEGHWRGEAVGTQKDESTFPQELSLTRMESGQIVCVVRDITTRKNRMRELERYHAFVEHSQDPITVVDERGRIQYNSPSIERILGYDQDELLEKNAFEFMHPEDRDRVRDRLQRDLVVSDGTAKDEFRFRHADGSWVWIEIVAKNRLGDPNIEDIIINQRDISERKEYEQDLEQANDQLRVINRIVRHDIRNDMNIVLGWGRELKGHVDDEGEQMLRHILANGQHVVDLTKTLRDYMRAYQDEEKPDITPIDIGNVLETEIGKLEERYARAEVDVPEELPHTEVRANKLISSVFWNLLQNAVKHNDKEVPRIEIGAKADNETVTVRIGDNGPGIPEDQRKVIFGKGESGLDDPNAGIGLYLVNTVVTQYGGDVWVEENHPEGAVFVVELRKETSEN